MAYKLEDWTKRIRNRSDMSGYVYHLTRGNDSLETIDVIIKILNDRKLNGSTTNSGFIVGSNKAVCFQDTTTYGLCQNTYHEQILRSNDKKLKVRYRPIGLAFEKTYVYEKGGRPVIYEKTEDAKKLLDKDEWWRIVNFDLSNRDQIIDWTHEREWRIKGDFEFDISKTIVVLVNNKTYKKFISKVDKNILQYIGGIIVLDPILT
ncbi:hypothetical protein B0P06_004293 [Clostridium saccharoperbutylacetonicum]|nr:DUF2971 domain-containing protein [Clostridium saccharoperbutylacetonicum]NRT61825.1 hypothetical protein [Clostridium saccharoperbutylacetonicum]NSB25151.1 hypothetical protein [Clostridium saccharoperbutylacetonicum]NSB44522.1 hypothetical protein [Clostridium saccharoperbutylacetonicum]